MRVISWCSNSASVGTGWSSAVGVVTTTSVSAVESGAAGRRSAWSFDSTVRRSLEAVKASRISRLSVRDSGNIRTSGRCGVPAAAWKKATSSASCSAMRSSSTTTSQTGAGCRSIRETRTAARAAGQTPVILQRWTEAIIARAAAEIGGARPSLGRGGLRRGEREQRRPGRGFLGQLFR